MPQIQNTNKNNNLAQDIRESIKNLNDIPKGVDGYAKAQYEIFQLYCAISLETYVNLEGRLVDITQALSHLSQCMETDITQSAKEYWFKEMMSIEPASRHFSDAQIKLHNYYFNRYLDNTISLDTKIKNLREAFQYLLTARETGNIHAVTALDDFQNRHEKTTAYSWLSLQQLVDLELESRLMKINPAHPEFSEAQKILFEIYYYSRRCYIIYENAEHRYSDITKAFQYLLAAYRKTDFFHHAFIDHYDLANCLDVDQHVDTEILNNIVWKAVFDEMQGTNEVSDMIFSYSEDQSRFYVEEHRRHHLYKVNLAEMPDSYETQFNKAIYELGLGPVATTEWINWLNTQDNVKGIPARIEENTRTYPVNIDFDTLPLAQHEFLYFVGASGREFARAELKDNKLVIHGFSHDIRITIKGRCALQAIEIHNPHAASHLSCQIKTPHSLLVLANTDELVCQGEIKSKQVIDLDVSGNLILHKNLIMTGKGTIIAKSDNLKVLGKIASQQQFISRVRKNTEILPDSLIEGATGVLLGSNTFTDLRGDVISEGEISFIANNDIYLHGAAVINAKANVKVKAKAVLLTDKAELYSDADIIFDVKTLTVDKQAHLYALTGTLKLKADKIKIHHNFSAKNLAIEAEETILYKSGTIRVTESSSITGGSFWRAGKFRYGKKCTIQLNKLFVQGVVDSSEVTSLYKDWKNAVKRPSFKGGAVVVGCAAYLNLLSPMNTKKFNLITIANLSVTYEKFVFSNKSSIINLNYDIALPNAAAMLGSVKNKMNQLIKGNYQQIADDILSWDTASNLVNFLRWSIKNIAPLLFHVPLFVGKVVDITWGFLMFIVNSKEMFRACMQLRHLTRPLEFRDLIPLIGLLKGLGNQAILTGMECNGIQQSDLSNTQHNPWSNGDVAPILMDFLTLVAPSSYSDSVFEVAGGLSLDGSRTRRALFSYTPKGLSVGLNISNTALYARRDGDSYANNIAEEAKQQSGNGELHSNSLSLSIQSLQSCGAISAGHASVAIQDWHQTNDAHLNDATVQLGHHEIAKEATFTENNSQERVDTLDNHGVMDLTQSKLAVTELLNADAGSTTHLSQTEASVQAAVLAGSGGLTESKLISPNQITFTEQANYHLNDSAVGAEKSLNQLGSLGLSGEVVLNAPTIVTNKDSKMEGDALLDLTGHVVGPDANVHVKQLILDDGSLSSNEVLALIQSTGAYKNYSSENLQITTAQTVTLTQQLNLHRGVAILAGAINVQQSINSDKNILLDAKSGNANVNADIHSTEQVTVLSDQQKVILTGATINGDKGNTVNGKLGVDLISTEETVTEIQTQHLVEKNPEAITYVDPMSPIAQSGINIPVFLHGQKKILHLGRYDVNFSSAVPKTVRHQANITSHAANNVQSENGSIGLNKGSSITGQTNTILAEINVNLDQSTISGFVTIVHANQSDVNNNGGLIHGDNYVEVISFKARVNNRAVDLPYQDRFGQRMAWKPGIISGGSGIDHNNVGALVLAGDRVNNDASTISAVGNTIVYGGKAGVFCTLRINRYVSGHDTDSSFFGLNETETTTIDIEFKKAEITSTNGRTTTATDPGGELYLVGADVTGKNGNDLYADKAKITLLDVVTQSEVHTNESHLLGLIKYQRDEYEDKSIPTRIKAIDPSITRIHADELLSRATEIEAPGEMEWNVDNATFLASKLQHVVNEKKSGLTLDLFGIKLLDPTQNEKPALFKPDPTYAAGEQLVHSSNPLEFGLNALNTAANGKNTYADVNKAIANQRLPTMLGQRYGTTPTDDVNLTVGYATLKSKTTQSYFALGYLYTDKLTANIKDTLNMTGVPLIVTGDMDLNAGHFIQNGVEQTTTFQSERNAVTVSPGTKPNTVDVGIEHQLTNAHSSNYQNQELYVGGTLNIHTPNWDMNGANNDLGQLKGKVGKLNITSHLNTSEENTEAFSANTSGSFSYQTSHDEDTTLTQVSSNLVHGENSLQVDEITTTVPETSGKHENHGFSINVPEVQRAFTPEEKVPDLSITEMTPTQDSPADNAADANEDNTAGTSMTNTTQQQADDVDVDLSLLTHPLVVYPVETKPDADLTYAEAPFLGAKWAAQSFWNTLTHLDEVALNTVSLVNDIILLDDYDLLVGQGPSKEALLRLNKRWNNYEDSIKDAIDNFSNARGPGKLALATEYTINAILPGTSIKSLRLIGSTAVWSEQFSANMLFRYTAKADPELSFTRQYEMLNKNIGYNIMPNHSFINHPDYLGSLDRGLYITDYSTIGDVLGPIRANQRFAVGFFSHGNQVSYFKATLLEKQLGLKSSALEDGFTFSRIAAIQDKHPRTPLTGNLHHRAGEGLPNGGPEMAIDRLPTQEWPWKSKPAQSSLLAQHGVLANKPSTSKFNSLESGAPEFKK